MQRRRARPVGTGPRAAAAAAAFLLLASRDASAERVTVTVPAASEPVSASGIAFTPEGVATVRSADVRPSGPGAFSVSFELPGEMAGRDDLSWTASVTAGDGSVTYGHVVSSRLGTAPPLPVCPPPAAVPAQMAINSGVLATLAEIRSNRRAISKQKVASYMEEGALAKMRSLEEGFGLARGAPLSPDLSPYELVDRLSALLNVMKSYYSLKSSREERPDPAGGGPAPGPR